MRKIISILYSTLISLVFIGVIGFFTYSLVSEYQHGALRVQKRITTLEKDIKEIPSNYNPGTKDFSSILYSKLGNLTDFSSIIIRYNEDLIFIYPTVSSTILEIPEDNSDSSLITKFNKKIPFNNGNISIDAGLYILRPSSIYNYSRLSFLIIMAATLLTVIFIIIYNLTENRKRKPSKSKNKEVFTNVVEYIEPEKEDKEAVESNSDYSFISKTEEIEDETSVDSENEINETSDSMITSKENNDSEKNNSEDTTAEEMPSTEVIQLNNELTYDNANLPLDDNKPLEMTTSNPSGLFSPVTGFGWQNYLEPRLNNELNRATASEVDLSFFIIKIPALLSCSDDLLMNICKVIDSNFQFKDLIFEYSDDCFAGLKLNISVDEAIIFANSLINELKSILPADNKDCFIGISSRSIRMVDARTVIHETQEALNYAVSQTNEPVIAFRVDTAKYRRYVELD